MRFKRRASVVRAVQWKGWPHQIKGIGEGYYPQIAYFKTREGCVLEVYKGDWIVTESGETKPWKDHEFQRTFKKI